MNTNLQDVIKKIRGLQANADSYKDLGNLVAAESYAAKVSELLYKYRLDLSDLELEELNQSEQVEEEYFMPDTPKNQRVIWQARLGHVIATAHNCEVLSLNRQNKLLIVGRKSERDVVKHLTIVLSRALRNEADNRLFMEQWGKSGTNSFLHGAVTGIAQQFADRKKKAQEDAGSRALVLFDKAAQDYVRQNMNVGQVKSQTRLNHKAQGDGFVYGSNISIQDAMNGSSVSQKYLR